jgi:hypothetical protein
MIDDPRAVTSRLTGNSHSLIQILIALCTQMRKIYRGAAKTLYGRLSMT